MFETLEPFRNDVGTFGPFHGGGNRVNGRGLFSPLLPPRPLAISINCSRGGGGCSTTCSLVLFAHRNFRSREHSGLSSGVFGSDTRTVGGNVTAPNELTRTQPTVHTKVRTVVANCVFAQLI